MQGHLLRWRVAALAALVFIVPFTGRAAEVIKDFRVSAALNRERGLVVEEAITYDFGEAERHGIFRNIPVTYSRTGGTYQLRLTVDQVTLDGEDEVYETNTTEGQLKVKIGTKVRTLSGVHTYVIRYRTDRAINFFNDGHSELYWNVTGNEWDLPIEQASFALKTPSGADLATISSICYVGAVGSQEQSCDVKKTGDGFVVAASRVLLPQEGLTIAVAFPRDVIRAPSVMERVWQFFQDNGVLFFPVAAFVIMFWRWWTKGKDPSRRTVVPEYEPPRKLSPALIGGTMTDTGMSNTAVTATIIDLARRGYLHIRFGEAKKLFGTEQTFTFVKQRPADDGMTKAERLLFNGLFVSGDERTVDQLRADKFYTTVATFRAAITKQVDEMGVFAANPTTTRGAYIVVGFIVGWVMIVGFKANAVEAAAAIATGLIIAGFGWFMPRRTVDGVALLAQIDGFKWFLSVTEKDRLAFTDAPERTPAQFQAFLPYAIVFGVEEKWGQQFASMHVPPPDWAEGNLVGFNTIMLGSNLSHLNKSASSAAFSPPSQGGSGGSGFSGGGSGGGMGGGGGGSW